MATQSIKYQGTFMDKDANSVEAHTLMQICNICLELQKPGTISKSLIGNYNTRDDLFDRLNQTIELLNKIRQKSQHV